MGNCSVPPCKLTVAFVAKGTFVPAVVMPPPPKVATVSVSMPFITKVPAPILAKLAPLITP